ncbi:MAG: hypothetical protein U1G05_09345 [Kiritimatiellia bacterium]
MHMTLIDWIVVAGVLGLFTGVAVLANRMTRSVADYLVAGRGPGGTCSRCRREPNGSG